MPAWEGVFLMLRAGQRVVCVHDYGGRVSRSGVILPDKDGVYVIREFDDSGSEPGLRLREIVNAPMQHTNVAGLIEPAFPVRYFRPVVSRPTDISLFTKMLTDERLPDLVVLQKLLERT
jgi:hypothetical protein